MGKKQLRKSEIKELNDLIIKLVPSFVINKKDIVENIKTNDYNLILINNEPCFFYDDNKLIPTLKFVLKNENILLKKVTVDMGAVRFVTSGADIMRPGITLFDENIDENDYVVVIDENNKKPLSISKALFGSEQLNEMKTGKVLKNIHYVTDKIWQFS
jgi:PUA-domain protein